MNRNKWDVNYRCDSVSEQNRVQYFTFPALQNIAALNIVTELWKLPDLKEELEKNACNFRRFGGTQYSHRIEIFDLIEKKVLQKLFHLPLPGPLKDEIADLIRPIGLQILEWIDPEPEDYLDRNYLQDAIYWTVDGSIDKVKTLETRLHGKHLVHTYEKACEYCSEGQIAYLWERVSKDIRENLFNRKYEAYRFHLIAYWTCFFSNELPKLLSIIKPSDHNNLYDCNHSVYKNIFTLSVRQGYVLAVKYFWHKLTDEEKSTNIINWTQMAIERSTPDRYQETNEYTDVLCFLLSQMNDKEQQREVLQRNSRAILKALFSHWPWQRFLLPTIRVMWDYLEEQTHVLFLLYVACEIREGWCIEKLLKELWSGSPINVKECIVKDTIWGASVLRKLLQVEDLETMKLILNDASTEEKKRIIFLVIEKSNELFQLIYAGKLSLFDILIGENLCQRDIESLKETVVRNQGNNLCREWICNDNWRAVEEFLNWSFMTESQIITFKRNITDKAKITASLVRLDKYESVEKFLHWCFSSERDITHFKMELVYGICENNGVVDILAHEDWDVFEKFMSWCFTCDRDMNEFKEYRCFTCDRDMNEFKEYLSQHAALNSVLYTAIANKYNFEFAKKLLKWCFNYHEVIQRFKIKFLFAKGLEIFEKFTTNNGLCNSKYTYWELGKKLSSYWELGKKLAKWFYPLEKSVITKLKEELKKKIPESDFNWKMSYWSKTRGENLFDALDNFSLDDVSCNEDNSSLNVYNMACRVDEIMENDSEDSSWNINSDAASVLPNLMDVDDDCTASDYIGDNSNFNDDVVVVLSEVINKVEDSWFQK